MMWTRFSSLRKQKNADYISVLVIAWKNVECFAFRPSDGKCDDPLGILAQSLEKRENFLHCASISVCKCRYQKFHLSPLSASDEDEKL